MTKNPCVGPVACKTGVNRFHDRFVLEGKQDLPLTKKRATRIASGVLSLPVKRRAISSPDTIGVMDSKWMDRVPNTETYSSGTMEKHL